MRYAYVPTVLAVLFAIAPSTCVFALPDATITYVTAEGRDLRGGDKVPLRVMIANRGDSALPRIPVVLAVDEHAYSEWVLPSALAPGDSVIWPLEWSATRGSHLILATADPLNDVPESNEANNSGFISIGVGEEPEPSPWPAALAGLGAFLFGALAAFVAQRLRLKPRPSTVAPRLGQSVPGDQPEDTG